jgi:hypothetical protein
MTEAKKRFLKDLLIRGEAVEKSKGREATAWRHACHYKEKSVY